MMHRHTRPSLALLLLCHLPLLLAPPILNAQGPDLLGYDKPSDLLDQIRIESKIDQYYILRAGATIEEITTGDAAAMMLGSGSSEILSASATIPGFSASQGFFYVEEVPLASPLDLDRDGISDAFELQHPTALNPLNAADDTLDPDGDGMSSLQEFLEGFNPEVADSYFIKGLSPAAGETLVSLTRETILRFHGEIDPATVTTDSFYLLAGSDRVPGRVVVSSTRRFATFYYDAPLPASTEFRIVIDGDTIQLANGSPFDGDADGIPGGIGEFDFRTLPITRIPGTTVFGFVRDSNTLAPLQGVTIRVDAFPAANVVTDANGRFELTDMPAPDFFVHIDGSTADAPAGFTYPNVGKPFHSIPGQTVQINMAGEPFDIYLPPMALADIQPLEPDDTTTVVFGPTATSTLENMFPSVDPTLWSEMRLVVAPGSAQDDTGSAATTATMVPVPADRLPAPLPPGVVSDLVISIQAPGATTFDVPAPVTFPNLEGLPPGSKTAIVSFDHDAGVWRVVGPATVSADGRSVVSDPGVGIVAPGWHLPSLLADLITGGGADPSDGCAQEGVGLASAGIQCGVAAAADAASGGLGGGPAAAIIGVGFDCGFELGSTGGLGAGCAQSATLNAAGTFIPIPYAGTVANCFGAGVALGNFLICAFSKRSGRVDPPDVGNFLADQERLIAAATDMRLALYDPIWSMIDFEGDVLFKNLVAAITTAVQEDADLTPVVTPAKRAAILALPRPPGTTEQHVEDLIERVGHLEFNDYISAGIDLQAYLEAAGEFLAIWEELEAKGWVTFNDGFTRFWPEFLDTLATDLDGQPVDDKLHYHLFSSDFEQRGDLDLGLVGTPINVSPNQSFTIRYARSVVDLDANGLPLSVSYRIATTAATAGGPGSSTQIPTAVFGPADPTDTDGDGLPDEVETILGTNPNSADSDGDGITDEAELLQGLNPLDNVSFPLGVVASVELSGTPTAITIDGAPNDIFRSTATVATGPSGVSLLDVTDFDNPILLGELDLPGTGTDVAADPRFARAAVAAGADGVHLIDTTDPMMPTLLTTIPIDATQIEAYKGLLYAGGDFDLFLVDLVTGDILGRVPGAETIGMAREGSFLYTVGNNHEIQVYDVSGFLPVARGTVSVPNAAGPMHAENGVLHVVAESRGGYHTVDISDPDAPLLIAPSGFASPFIGSGDDFAGNGTGRGLLVGQFGADLMATDNPNVTTNALTRFDAGARPTTVAIARGVAFTGLNNGTFATLNYLAFDANGIPPVPTLSAPGVPTQIPEGTTIELQVDIVEDVQVRNVELLVDDMFVFNDLSAPFDFVLRAPATEFGVNLPFQVKVRVTDTGGNTRESNILSFQSLNDPTPPSLLASSPSTNAAGVDVSSIALFFDRPIDPADALLSNFTLTSLGPDGAPGGGDDTPFGLSALTQIDGIRLQLFTDGTLPQGIYQLGGAFGSVTFRALSLVPGTVQWVGTSGSWDNPFNWSTGNLPAPSDNVSIDVFGQDALIEIPAGNFEAASLISTEHLNIDTGTLTLRDAGPNAFNALDVCIFNNGRLALSGGGTVSQSLVLGPRGTLEANGADATFTTTAPVSISGGSLEALGGGTITLPTAAAWLHASTSSSRNRLLRADGAGSTIALPNLTLIANDGPINSDFLIEALTGGTIDLSGVDRIITSGNPISSQLDILADGAGSQIDLASLREFRGGSSTPSSLTAINSGTINTPILQSIDRVNLTLNATGTLPTDALTRIHNGQLTFDRTPGNLPNLTDVSDTRLEVNQTTVSLPSLTRADGASFIVEGGGTLTLSGLTTYYHGADANGQDRFLRAEGAGSTLNLPNLATILNGEFYDADLVIEALTGGSIDLSALIRINDPERGDQRQRDHVLRADGFGSTLRLDSLRDLLDPSLDGSFTFAAENGGAITAPLLSHAAGVTSPFSSLANTPTGQLQTFTDGALRIDGVSPDLAALEDLNGSTVELLGGTLNLPAFPAMRGASFIVRNGGTLTAPALVSYRHGGTANGIDRTFLAEGVGSTLNFPALLNIINGTPYDSDVNITAASGGTIDLSALIQLTDPPEGDARQREFFISADGIGSAIDFSALRLAHDANTDKRSTLIALNSGTITAPNLQRVSRFILERSSTSDSPLDALVQLNHSHLTLNGTTPAFTTLTDIRGTTFNIQGANLTFPAANRADGFSIFLSAGGIATLPLPVTVRHASTANGQDRIWSAIGAGTRLSLPNLATLINGDNYDSDLQLLAGAGGTLDLPALTQIVDPNRGDTRQRNILLEADGAGSSITLPALLNLIDLNSDVLSEIRPNLGGLITYPEPLLTQNTITNGTSSSQPAIKSTDPGTPETKTVAARGEPDAIPTIDVPFAARRAVTFTATSGNWSDPANWSPGLPAANDDVTIPAGRTVTIDTEANSPIVRSITAAGGLQLDIGTLSLWGPTVLSGPLTLSPNTTLLLAGPLATLTASGTTTIDGASIQALNGATCTLPNVTTYDAASDANSRDRVFLADGPQSRIELPGLTAIRNGENYDCDITLRAVHGGQVNLPALTNITDPSTGDTRQRQVFITADGLDSQIDLGNLTTFQDINRDARSLITSVNGGEIIADSLATLTSTEINLAPDSALTAPALASLTDCILRLDGVSVPGALQSILRSTLEISDTAAILDNLTTIDGASLIVKHGSSLTIPNITAYNHASDANGLNREFFAEAGSLLSLPNLATITNGENYDSRVFLTALSGGRIALPELQQMTGPSTGDARQRAFALRADGHASRIELPKLANLIDRASDALSTLRATRGGVLQTPLLANLTATDIALNTHGTIDIAAVQNLTDGKLTGDRTAPVVPALVNAAGTTFEMSGTIFEAASLTTLNGSSFRALDGGVLRFPALANYAHDATANGQIRVFLAEGSGSRLEFPNLVSITNGENYDSRIHLTALAGGVLDFPAVQQLIDPAAGDSRERHIDLLANGPDSTINLPVLLNLTDRNRDERSTLTAIADGTIHCPLLANASATQITLSPEGAIDTDALTTFTDGHLRLVNTNRPFPNLATGNGTHFDADGPGVTLAIPTLTNADAASFTAASGGTIELTGIATYTHQTTANGQTRTWFTEGADSRITFPNLTQITNGENYDATLRLTATAGGQIALPALTQILESPSGDARQRQVTILADGANSRIDMPILATFEDINNDELSTITETNRGTIDYNAGTAALTNVTEP